MKIKNCRICNNRKFNKLFSLGKQSFTGKFSNNRKLNIKKDYINLIQCTKCHLVQLDRNFNPKFLYSNDYGYRTGINKTMTNHVKSIVKKVKKISKIKKGDAVLDIASNDGTLLNFYNKDIITVGIDPILNKYKKNYKKINYSIPGFFNFKLIKKTKVKKFKAITALSVFYDLHDPNKFIKDIKKILHPDGIFILEHADLTLILKKNLFDTICHEHLEYYSTSNIDYILNNNGLEIANHEFNSINGGSSQYLIVHKGSKYKVNHNKIKKLKLEEIKYGINKKSTYVNFFKKINRIKFNLLRLLKKIKDKKRIIHGYGASTKGNVLLQFFGISKNSIDCIADRNPAKNNFYTPGTKIKIVTEKISRKIKPDYYLVLPWHFKEEILIREKNIRKKGVKFIFPLPNLKIY